MNCDSAKRCYSEAFDERLGEPLNRRFEEHLSECDPCQAAFRDYRTLFSAVRSVPSTHTQRELPLPNSATSFGVRDRGLRVSRSVAAAAIFLLVAGASFAGFQYGQKSGAVSESGSEMPAGEVANVDYPSKPAGKALRRLTNTVGLMGPMLDAAVQDPTPRTMAAVNRAVRGLPLERDAGYLRRMDTASLGSYKEPIHRFADEAIRIHRTLSGATEMRADSMKTWVVNLRRRMTERDLTDHFELMRRISKPYEVEPFRTSSPRGDVEDHFMDGLRAWVNEEHDQALVFLGQALGSTELGTLVDCLTLDLRRRGVARGNRFEFQRGGSKGTIELHIAPGSTKWRGTHRGEVIIRGRSREGVQIRGTRRNAPAVIVPDKDARRRRLAQDL